MYSLFTSVVECHSRLLLQCALQAEHQATVVQVVALLLQCAATPGQYPTDETTSNIPFAVWFTIQVSAGFDTDNGDVLFWNAFYMYGDDMLF